MRDVFPIKNIQRESRSYGVGQVLFSIIIPMYNVDAYIIECLQSVLSQSCSSKELIVIDDQSSDNSVSYCQALMAQGYDFILLGQRQAGPNVARNLGISYANGQYLIFIDADDKLTPNALEILSSELRRFPEAEVVSFGYQFFNDKTGFIRKAFRPSRRHLNSKNIFIESLRGRDFGGVCWNKCYNRSFILENNISFIPDRIHGRDLIFSRSVAFYAQDWRSIDSVVYQSRLRSGSYSRDFSERNIFSAIDVTSKHLEIFKSDAMSLGLLRDLYFAIYRHLRYIAILSAFRSRNYIEYENCSNKIREYYNYTFPMRGLAQNNLSLLDRIIFRLVLKTRLLWSITRLIKLLNYEPY